MAGGTITTLVDNLLSAEKTLQGIPDWRLVGNGEEHRLVLPIFVDGRSSDASVEIDAYPNAPILRYRIMLNVEKCVWRIDYVDYERHVNPLDTFSQITPCSFTCPHYHSWSDNRRYATTHSLPKRLLIARPLPDQLANKSFEAVFRWFCGEINIYQPPSDMVSLPSKTRLI